ncbi:MAG: 16S rRNA (cytidine(1402)-2'-O)-methyltransferase [Pseudomonadota bacterium]
MKDAPASAPASANEKNDLPSQALAPGLYVAATPIGNLGDASFRLIDTMKRADAVLCEDTRHTAKLCAAYGVTTPRRPYHEHNAASVRPQLIEDLKNGACYCLVSDAGTPLIADPGYKLVAEARDAGIDVFTLPGPSAAIAALSISGLPTDRFLFAGFPPAKSGARKRFFDDLAKIDATLVFYEAPGRLADSLDAMATAFKGRTAAIARELTKRHETLINGPIETLAETFRSQNTKGEIVVLIGPPAAPTTVSESDLDAFLEDALTAMSVRDAAAAAADALGVAKKEAYRRAVALAAARAKARKETP